MLSILTPGASELVVMLSGEIDHHSVSAMRQDIDDAIERQQPKKLVLDFSGVTFMDSSGIGLVMGRYKLVSSLGGGISIVNTPKNLRKVMRLAGLDRLAQIDNGGNDR